MSLFAVAQLLVALAICLNILALQCRQRRTIILLLLVSCSLVAVHFLLLGYTTAAGLLLLSMARLAVGLWTVSKKMMGLFALAAIILTALTFTGWLSLLSCAAVLLSTIASFSEDDRRLRLAFMCAACLWVVDNGVVGSPGAMANDALFLVSNLIGYYRFHIRPKRHLLS